MLADNIIGDIGVQPVLNVEKTNSDGSLRVTYHQNTGKLC